MGKDGGGGTSGGMFITTTKSSGTVYDLHISTLQIIENQLIRLHLTLERADGDIDVTQEQIGQLQDELCRLSQSLGDAEIACFIAGKA